MGFVTPTPPVSKPQPQQEPEERPDAGGQWVKCSQCGGFGCEECRNTGFELTP